MTPAVGKPLDRVDGRQKVTGTARFAAEYDLPGLAHGVIVTSTVAKGRVTAFDTAAAERAPGVLAVVTPKNAPKLRPTEPFGSSETKPVAGTTTAPVLQSDQVFWYGQPIAVVVAGTLDQAKYAAHLVRVTYDAKPAELTLDSKGRVFVPDKVQQEEPEITIGDAEGALTAAAVKMDHTYTTPQHNHNAIEPHATVAAWDGGKLTVYDTTQFVFGVRYDLATRFGLKLDDVRVLAPFVGGGFGGKGGAWPQAFLAATAAKVVGRPVKLVLGRDQVYACVGGRTPTRQRVALGADAGGKLTTLIHTGRT